MPAIETPFFLPDGSETDLQAGDELAWDPNAFTLEITRLSADGKRLSLLVTQKDGPKRSVTTLPESLERLQPDAGIIQHIQGTIEQILAMLDLPLMPVLLRPTDDRIIFRLE